MIIIVIIGVITSRHSRLRTREILQDSAKANTVGRGVGVKHILLPKHPRNSSLPQLFQLRPHLSCLPPRQDRHILLHDRSGFQRAVTSPLLTRFGKGCTVQVLVCVLDASSRWLGGNEPSLPYPLSHQDIKLGRAPECTAVPPTGNSLLTVK